ncbi:hypothetical protein ACWEF9_11520 [Streptomyces sp. NPDC004980]
MAAGDWRALGTSVRLVTTDPALLGSCNLLLARYLAEVDAACSRFRQDSELVALDGSAGRGPARQRTAPLRLLAGVTARPCHPR